MKIGSLSVNLKVCGMREPENIVAVSALRPDYLGFIFYGASARGVGKDFRMPDGVPDSIRRVGVFVNETLDGIKGIADDVDLDLVQLHGEEPPELCRQVQSLGLGVIKAFSIDEAFDFASVDPYRKVVDYFLFDTKGRGYGGTGKVFDWSLLKKYDQQVPFFLGGGLSPANIAQVESLSGMNIFAVDLNSGFEARPGVKSVELIRKVQGSKSNVQGPGNDD